MSSHLPPNPNHENLKKQAKSLQKAHRSGDSHAAERIKGHLPRLANSSPEEILQSEISLQEAQLVIAREYGFLSWPKLVEAVSQAPRSPTDQKSPPDLPEGVSQPFPPFTDHAKKVIGLARDESVRLGHDYIGTEHLLLGIIADGEGSAVEMLTQLGLDLDRVRQSIEDYTSTSRDLPKATERPFAPRTRQILEMASREVRERGDEQADVEHLLLALVKDREGVAGQILAAFGVLYPTLQSLLDGEPPPQRKKRIPRVTHSPSTDWTEWRDEMRHLSDTDLEQLKEALEHFFVVTESVGFIPVLFPESRILLDLINHELKRRQR